MKVWIEGSNRIECSLEHVKDSLKNLGEYYVGVTRLMPGLSLVELVDQAEDAVTIKTNEGLMMRTNISVSVDSESVVVEFDEEYQAGRLVTTKGHFRDEFTTTSTGVSHRMVISGVEAPGFLGFFYRKFGSSSTGKALLGSCKDYLEKERAVLPGPTVQEE
jgi:hypothetical protein